MTLSTSVPKHAREVFDAGWQASVRRYAIASGFCALFSVVYEYFSHGVISVWMVCLALVPLLLGVVPALACGLIGVRVRSLTRQLWACGVLTFTLGSCLAGVFEIYGSTSPFVTWYFPVAAGFLVAALICEAVTLTKRDTPI